MSLSNRPSPITMQRKPRADGADAFLHDPQPRGARGHHSHSNVELAEARAEAFVTAINAASETAELETTSELTAAGLSIFHGEEAEEDATDEPRESR